MMMRAATREGVELAGGASDAARATRIWLRCSVPAGDWMEELVRTALLDEGTKKSHCGPIDALGVAAAVFKICAWGRLLTVQHRGGRGWRHWRMSGQSALRVAVTP
jgi:hypothetical protein